jgi:hypothetical protein
MAKYVYLFNEGNASMRNLLGGKGANLAEMTGLGLPVPRGFTVSTEACTRYYEDRMTISKDIEDEIYSALEKTEKIVGKKLGDSSNPFLVSVRSGSRASMPGMMDTILNLGLNDEVVEGLAKLTNNSRFAYDSYRRFIHMFSDVVMGLEKAKFEKIFDGVKEKNGVKLDTELTTDNLKEIVKGYKELFKKEKGFDFPQDPKVQLMEAVKAVFKSWDNPRAIVYRRLNDIPSDWGTAVNVQEMVYGNMGEDSGTGVAFTRNPATGENKLYGEFLMNAQGEDVVAGIRTPETIDHLNDLMPEVYNQFVDIAQKLEDHYKDMQDMEFTIERGKLFMLQTRNGKRTANAALKIAVDLVSEGMITKEEAILKVDPRQLDTLLHPNFEPKALKAATPIAKGLPASPGAATGKVYFTAEAAVEAVKGGEKKVVLVRLETSPEDIYVDAFIKMVVTAMGNSVRESTTGYWADPYIEMARTLALIFDGEFDTFQRPITRQEMAMIIVRGSSDEFPDNFNDYRKLILDIDYSNMYLTDYILKAYSTGIVTGLPDGTFNPQNNAQRAEAAAMIHRMIDSTQRKIPSLVMETTVRAEVDKEFEDFINSEEGAEYASNYYFKAENGAIIFRNNGLGEVLPNNSHFKDINKITYNIIKELVSYARRDNHYVRAFYSPSTYRVGVHYYQNRVVGEKALHTGNFYISLEPLPKKYNESQKHDTYLHWRVGRLWDDSHIDEFFADNEFMSMEYYEPLQAIFNIAYGNEDGQKLFEYAINEYLEERRQGMERENLSTIYINDIEIVNENDNSFNINFKTNIR